MNFASDNTGPVHPNVMAALNAANMGYALPYGADDATAQAVQDIRDVFEACLNPGRRCFVIRLRISMRMNAMRRNFIPAGPSSHWCPVMTRK